MYSSVADAIGLKYEPLVMLFAASKPEKARQFKEGKWGCVMFMVAAVSRSASIPWPRPGVICRGPCWDSTIRQPGISETTAPRRRAQLCRTAEAVSGNGGQSRREFSLGRYLAATAHDGVVLRVL